MPEFLKDPITLKAAVAVASDGGSGESGTEKYILITLASLAALVACDAFMNHFDFCPICGGDGKVTIKQPGVRYVSGGVCPLILLRPDWHTSIG